ncbi:M1 family metallopeptidase [Hyphomonas sp.]|uniref:M1 family metallopeptidase n=1 Tax=Hyphomonas sp. TaxID=87 RepID=UPI0035279D75
MKTRFTSALLAGVASVVLVSACSTPADTVAASVETETAATEAPVLHAEIPKGQLPTGVRPTAYRLDLVTDPNAATFTGQEEIDINLEKPHSRIWLHALGPDVASIKAVLPDGMEIGATFTGDQTPDGVARIDFDAPLPAGDATLVLEYEAPYNLHLAGLYKVEQGGLPYLVTQFEDIDARRMFVSFDEPRFKTPYTVTITAPAEMEVTANGAETDAEDLGDGLVRHHFATTRPLQSYLVAIMVGPYDKVEADPIPATDLRPDPIPLRAYAPAGKGEKLKDALAITDEMVEWQESYFDYPYPYGKLDLIAAADFAYGAMENAGAIVYREAALLIDDRTSLTRRRAIYGTHAHELGHQWFGNLVTPAWWNDIWLNEAFATWISTKTMNAIDPEGDWSLGPILSSLNAMPTDSLMSTRQIRNPILTTGDIGDAFDSITYRKGGAVLNMFETYLGEDTFRDGIRLHMRRFEDGVATTQDFMQSLADGSGQPDIVSSFTSFISQPGIPFLDVNVSCSAPTGAQMTITQSRYAPLGSKIDTEAQTWEIPFAARVSDASGDHVIRKMLSDKTTTIALDACPDWVMPNAGGAGYWRFATDADNAAALQANYASLSPAEQMMYMDSVSAGFDAGKLSAADYVSAFETSAGGSASAIYTSVNLTSTLESMLDDEGKAKFADWMETTYGPVWTYLSERPATALSTSERLLAPTLWTRLLEDGNRAGDRADMVARAKAFMGIGQEANASALPAEDLSAAVAAGVEDGDWDFYQGTVDFVRNSQNQTERVTILAAIAGEGTPDIVADLFKLSLSDDISGNELYSIYNYSLENQKAQSTVWPLIKDNFASIVAKIPLIRKQQMPKAVGYFCKAEDVADAKAFFESQADLIPGYERSLAQGAEHGENCSALRAATADDVKALFSGD